LITLALVIFFMALGVRRRMRPQPVRPNRLLVSGAIIVLLIGGSFVATGAHTIENPLGLALMPICLVAGVAIGYLVVRTMRFWIDRDSGELWMAGGAAFAIILVGTILLRFGVRYAATGNAFAPPTEGESGSFLGILSADLLLLTLGLWASRAVLLFLRYREHQAGGGAQPTGQPPTTPLSPR
jgi:membrane protein CcdC involved in cytochrome C biogenesis